ncbi:tetratricopeptide repeat protein [Kaustia mangrovi]|uniref:Tetratricopeptide repeat protein n=1 Tax=Kaustia mangrovi TaxID=2593653 RepID=A0A7S8HAZ4_9HYPH|nr:tetratricopeptide repeat protein [Kaustia mangrovi]QPC42102.1 tetratricopeptide repeat protein [Kaustia mangrovi]
MMLLRPIRTLGIVAGLGIAVSAFAASASQPGADALSSLSGNYLAGRHAIQERDMSAAARYFSDALAQDPGNAALLERAFVAEMSAGNITRSERLAERLIGINERHRMAHIVLGLKDFKRGRYDSALTHFDEASYTPIGELTAGLLSAWVHAAQRDPTGAFKALDVLDRNDSFGIYKTFHSALIADMLGMGTRAGPLYKKAYDEAGTSLRVVQAYGNFLERHGRPEEAEAVYRAYLDNAPENPLVRQAYDNVRHGMSPRPFVRNARSGIGEAMFSLSSALTDETGIDLALVYVRLALDVKPDLVVAQTLLGDIFTDMGRNQEAIEAYELVPASSPLRKNARIRAAGNLDAMGRTDEAEAMLKALVEREPDSYDAYMTLGNIMRSHSRFEDAAVYYSKVIELMDTPIPQQWTVFYFRGMSYERSKQWEKAEADLLKALELQPGQPLVLNYLGYSWIDQGVHLDEALDMIKESVDQRPNDGYIVDSLGWGYYRLGQYEKAVEQLERAVELKPDDPIINDHLGDAYWKVGRRLEAQFQWQHAKDSDPEPDLLETLDRKLERGLNGAEKPGPELALPENDKRS